MPTLPPRELIIPPPPPPSYNLLPSAENPYTCALLRGEYNSETLTSTTSKSAPDSVSSGKRKLLLVLAGCLADPDGVKNRYSAIRKLETGMQTEDIKATRVHSYTGTLRILHRLQGSAEICSRSRPPRALVDLADAGVEELGGSELQETMQEMRLGSTRLPLERTPGTLAQGLSPRIGK
ncbi:hypothetical protein HOY82DRAFT_589557 [Tuber indicum]|nr:hypothetical protein HOY82DRAFT_589557 [Tuber indicum]